MRPSLFILLLLPATPVNDWMDDYGGTADSWGVTGDTGWGCANHPSPLGGVNAATGTVTVKMIQTSFITQKARVKGRGSIPVPQGYPAPNGVTGRMDLQIYEQLNWTQKKADTQKTLWPGDTKVLPNPNVNLLTPALFIPLPNNLAIGEVLLSISQTGNAGIGIKSILSHCTREVTLGDGPPFGGGGSSGSGVGGWE